MEMTERSGFVAVGVHPRGAHPQSVKARLVQREGRGVAARSRALANEVVTWNSRMDCWGGTCTVVASSGVGVASASLKAYLSKSAKDEEFLPHPFPNALVTHLWAYSAFLQISRYNLDFLHHLRDLVVGVAGCQWSHAGLLASQNVRVGDKSSADAAQIVVVVVAQFVVVAQIVVVAAAVAQIVVVAAVVAQIVAAVVAQTVSAAAPDAAEKERTVRVCHSLEIVPFLLSNHSSFHED